MAEHLTEQGRQVLYVLSYLYKALYIVTTSVKEVGVLDKVVLIVEVGEGEGMSLSHSEVEGLMETNPFVVQALDLVEVESIVDIGERSVLIGSCLSISVCEVEVIAVLDPMDRVVVPLDATLSFDHLELEGVVLEGGELSSSEHGGELHLLGGLLDGDGVAVLDGEELEGADGVAGEAEVLHRL